MYDTKRGVSNLTLIPDGNLSVIYVGKPLEAHYPDFILEGTSPTDYVGTYLLH